MRAVDLTPFDSRDQLTISAICTKPRPIRSTPWRTNSAKPKLGQNLKYDKHIFANHGIALNGIVHDTLLQSYVFESHKSHDMDSLAMRHLERKTIPYQDVCGKGAEAAELTQKPKLLNEASVSTWFVAPVVMMPFSVG